MVEIRLINEKDWQGLYDLIEPVDKDLVGKEGVVSSDLKPSGHILVEDNYYQAVSKTGYIEKGRNIKVIGGQGARLICKEVKGE